MQIQGFGNHHTTDMHQVTECIHDHSTSKKSGGAASSGNALKTSAEQITQQEGQLSLLSWLKNTLSGGRRMLFKIWGDGSEATTAADIKGDNASQGKEQIMAQLDKANDGLRPKNVAGQEAAAAAMMQTQSLQNNPYFSAIEDTGRAKENVWAKLRVRFHSVTGYLTKHFSNRNSFQTKQEKPKEDLRRHSKYRKDELEIECILTDDSYLLDSYDRRGEYSKLSAVRTSTREKGV